MAAVMWWVICCNWKLLPGVVARLGSFAAVVVGLAALSLLLSTVPFMALVVVAGEPHPVSPELGIIISAAAVLSFLTLGFLVLLDLLQGPVLPLDPVGLLLLDLIPAVLDFGHTSVVAVEASNVGVLADAVISVAAAAVVSGAVVAVVLCAGPSGSIPATASVPVSVSAGTPAVVEEAAAFGVADRRFCCFVVGRLFLPFPLAFLSFDLLTNNFSVRF